MGSSPYLEPVLSVAAAALTLAGVAALARQVVGMALSNPISWEEKERLTRLYGRWAVQMAEALCPHGDVACVEREARRLYEVRRYRSKP